jgi:predicted dinucleotide-binding enzyme
MRIGIIGAGMIGSTMAKLWVEAGHEIRLSSRHPDALQAFVAELGQRAAAATPAQAARFGDVVMLTVPLAAVPGLASELAPSLAGKIVLDTGNAYEKRDADAALAAMKDPRGTAAWAADQFPGARWVKAFNTVYFKVLDREAHRKGDQVGIPLASDDKDALEVAAQLARDAGFDPVIIGPLARGKEFEPGARVYNTGMSGPELRAVFASNT